MEIALEIFIENDDEKDRELLDYLSGTLENIVVRLKSSVVTVHSVHSPIRKSIENSLREWDLLTPESCSYASNSKCLRLN